MAPVMGRSPDLPRVPEGPLDAFIAGLVLLIYVLVLMILTGAVLLAGGFNGTIH